MGNAWSKHVGKWYHDNKGSNGIESLGDAMRSANCKADFREKQKRVAMKTANKNLKVKGKKGSRKVRGGSTTVKEPALVGGSTAVKEPALVGGSTAVKEPTMVGGSTTVKEPALVGGSSLSPSEFSATPSPAGIKGGKKKNK
jgi:hypothetical protein